jgi:DNA-binding LacI/PurR family transcriptional regulator
MPRMSKQHRITIHDVARAAGVSTTTVSDALSGRGRLPDSTRERVTAVAGQLGYTANPGAQNLRRGRTGAIALYFPQHALGLEFYMDYAIGAAEEAMEHDLALTLVPATQAARGARMHVDGAIVCDPAIGDPMPEHVRGLGVPVVSCERDLTPGVEYAGTVLYDHRAAMRGLLAHLSDRGARSVGVISPGEETSFGFEQRQEYAAWCAGNDVIPVLAEVPYVSRPEDITRAAQQILSHAPAVDAIISVSDGGAVSALQTALVAGRRVPDDLMICACSDSPSLRTSSIPITAVDLAARETGRETVRLLADLIALRAKPGTVRIQPTELLVRESTSPS